MWDSKVEEMFTELQAATQQAHLVSRRGWVDDEWMAAWETVFRLQRELSDALSGPHPADRGGGPLDLREAPSDAVAR